MNTTSTHTTGMQGGPTSEGAGVVVGVDGSSNSLSAIAWAASEARRRGVTLRVLNVNDKRAVHTPRFIGEMADPFDVHLHAAEIVERVADDVRRDFRGLPVDAEFIDADPLFGLVEDSKSAALMVVGQRGIGLVRRVLAGSVSIALTGRSHAPVVVVPDGWKQEGHEGQSVLVGIDVESDNDELLAFAFEQAQRMGVPLVALHVWETHPAITHDPEVLAGWSAEARAAVEADLAPWRAKFPDVEALAAAERAHPIEGVLDAAENAQLLILGRKSAGGSAIGLGASSLVRSVLHATSRPVAVVPTKST